MPVTDEGEVRVNAEMEVGTRLGVLEKHFLPIEAIVNKEVPEAANVITLLGGSGWRQTGSHNGQLRISLKPQSQRETYEP